MTWPASIEIREVGPRDGLQNEAPVAIGERVRLIDALSRTGLRRIEAAAFVSPTTIPPMVGAEQVMAEIDRVQGVVYSALVPNAKGAERAIAAQVDEVEVVVSASETHNRKNVRRSVAESLMGARDVVELAHARRHRRRGDRLDRVRLPVRGRRRARAGRAACRPPDRRRCRPAVVRRHDRHGHATPCPRPARRARASGYRAGPRRPALSRHTRDRAAPNVVVALERGVTRFDASIGGLGGCPYAPGASGNAVTEDLVHMCHDMGIETGIDLDALVACAVLAGEIVGRELPSALLHAGPRSSQAQDAGRSVAPRATVRETEAVAG